MTALQAWETPSDYAGFDPVGHYGVLTIHRDSGLIDWAATDDGKCWDFEYHASW